MTAATAAACDDDSTRYLYPYTRFIHSNIYRMTTAVDFKREKEYFLCICISLHSRLSMNNAFLLTAHSQLSSSSSTSRNCSCILYVLQFARTSSFILMEETFKCLEDLPSHFSSAFMFYEAANSFSVVASRFPALLFTSDYFFRGVKCVRYGYGEWCLFVCKRKIE